MSKISELSDGGSLLPTDDLIVVRSGGNVRVKADTVNVDQIRLGDNEQIQLGNSQDLTLVHTSTQSIINQAGTGDLLIQKAGTTKLTVNSSGIDVTGSVTADGLVVDGASSGSTVATFTANANVDTPLLVFQRTGGAVAGKIGYDDTNTAINFGTTTNHEIRFLTNNTERMQLDASGNVGIGISPSSKLDINISTNARGYFADSIGEVTAGTFCLQVANSANTALKPLGFRAEDIRFATGSAERMRIDSSGNVGIGTGTPATPLNVAKNGDGTIVRLLSVGIGEWDFSMGNSSTLTGVGAGALELLPLNSGTGSEFAIGQAGSSTAVFHVKSGKVLIGTSTVAYAGTQLNIGTTSDAESGVQIQSATNGTGYVLFGDGASAAAYRGQVVYSHASDVMGFNAAGAEAMRISGGNLLVGTTDSTPYDNSANSTADNGIVAGAGLFAAARYQGSVGLFNRTGNDGEILGFKRSGAAVGSIGVTGTNDLYIATNTANHTGLRLGEGYYIPTNNSGASADNAVDLGLASVRYKDLYLSGGAYLGGTAAANKLDDYEEGDYDCAITCGTSGTISLNGSFNRAAYTKVGRLVTVHGFIVVSAVSSPVGYFTINLPFTPASLTDRAGDSTASLVLQNVASANISDFMGTLNEGDAKIYVQLGDNTAIQNDSAQQIAANTYIHFSTTYSTV